MSKYFDIVKDYVNRLSLDISFEDPEEELLIVNNEEKGIFNLIIDCEHPILVVEQLIYTIKSSTKTHFLELLKMNRNLIHGAFTINEEEDKVIFRDTLQLEHLDFNELEGTVNALTLGLAEYSEQLIDINNPS